MRLLMVLAAAALAAPAALAQGTLGTDLGDCPNDVRECKAQLTEAYATATVSVGPVTVIATLTIEGGDAEAEASAKADPGDAGTLTFRIVEGENATANETVNVTLRAYALDAPIAWDGENETRVSWTPEAGVVERTFRLRVLANATAGDHEVLFAAIVGNASAVGSLGITVVAAQPPANDAPGPAAGLVAVALAAGALLRRRAR